MELVQIFEKEWAEVSYKKEVIEQKDRGEKKPVIRCIAQNKPNVSYTFLCGLAGPLCRALREYRYNIKPQCRAKSPFEQFTCAFLYPVPRHLSSDTPCNYKRKEKEMSFDYFHPYCLHTQSGLLGQLQQEVVDSCTSVWQRDDGSVESQTVTKKWRGLKYHVCIVETQIFEVIVATVNLWGRTEKGSSLSRTETIKAPSLYLFL